MDMARRGYFAASVDYKNRNYPTDCAGFTKRARDIFDESVTWSAISAICDRQDTNCATIVASGFSQGANLASLSANYTSNVKAAYLIGNVEPTINDCYDIEDIMLSKTQIRSVMGEMDKYCGGNYNGVKSCLETTTGYYDGDCSSAHNCLQPDGSGWYIVQGSETDSGRSSHCFQYNDDSCTASTLDPNYHPNATNLWGLITAHEWLASFGVLTSGTPTPSLSLVPSEAPSITVAPSVTTTTGPSKGCRGNKVACVNDDDCCSNNCNCKGETCKCRGGRRLKGN